jgi:hypothetical protein
LIAGCISALPLAARTTHLSLLMTWYAIQRDAWLIFDLIKEKFLFLYNGCLTTFFIWIKTKSVVTNCTKEHHLLNQSVYFFNEFGTICLRVERARFTALFFNTCAHLAAKNLIIFKTVS